MLYLIYFCLKQQTNDTIKHSSQTANQIISVSTSENSL